MVFEGEAEFLGEGCPRVVRGRGEGKNDRVTLEWEDDPHELKKCRLVAVSVT